MDFYEVGLRQGKNVLLELIDRETLIADIYNRNFVGFNKYIKKLAGKNILASTSELRRSRDQKDYFFFFAGLISASEKSTKV